VKNVTIGSGEVVTQEKFIELNSGGTDELTEFLATRQDVWTLAQGIAREMLGLESQMEECSGSKDVYEMEYLKARLDRVIDFAPDLVDSIDKQLAEGRAKNYLDDRSLPKDAGCPKCFASLAYQLVCVDSVLFNVQPTNEGVWELGRLRSDLEHLRFFKFYCQLCGNEYTALHPRSAHEVADWAAEISGLAKV
jgi:hypothetical protein